MAEFDQSAIFLYLDGHDQEQRRMLMLSLSNCFCSLLIKTEEASVPLLFFSMDTSSTPSPLPPQKKSQFTLFNINMYAYKNQLVSNMTNKDGQVSSFTTFLISPKIHRVIENSDLICQI